jgi:dienelactone hydrolase
MEIVMFHSALGLRPAVLAAAERLRGAGHVVHTPDYYGGSTFDNVTDGVAHKDAVGMSELLRRAGKAVEGLPDGVVFAGMSLGATIAREVAKNRRAAALVLLHDSSHEPKAWKGPVALHAGEPDEWVEEDVFAEWAALPDDEAWRYSDVSHLYTDPDTAESCPADAAAAELTWQRVLTFLASLQPAGT